MGFAGLVPCGWVEPPVSLLDCLNGYPNGYEEVEIERNSQETNNNNNESLYGNDNLEMIERYIFRRLLFTKPSSSASIN